MSSTTTTTRTQCDGCNSQCEEPIVLTPIFTEEVFCDSCGEQYALPTMVFCSTWCARNNSKFIIDFEAPYVPGARVLIEDPCYSCDEQVTFEAEYQVDNVLKKGETVC